MIKKIVNQILSSEKKHNLFSTLVKGRPFWPYYRMYFYYALTKEMKVLDAADAKIKFSISYMMRVLSIFNFVRIFEKKEYFVLEHPRGNKENKDIYSNELVEALGKEKCAFFSFSQNGVIQKRQKVVILDLLKIFSKLVSKLLYRFMTIPSEFVTFLNDFEVDKSKYIKSYKRYYIEYVIQYYFYFYVLKFKKTQRVILVVSYYNMPLIAAAKNLHLEVIELQHGVISKYHLGYHYPYFEGDFFPNLLMVFSDYWKDVALFPTTTSLIASGNSYLFSDKSQMDKVDHTILVISQATIGKKLEKWLLRNIENLGIYTIYFKLHPNEFPLKDTKYKALKAFENIKMITDESTISELQNICEYQVGIYSTAIYEGLEKHCKTVVLNDTGVEYMEDLIDKNVVVLSEYESDIVEIFQNLKTNNTSTYFDTFNKQSIQEVLYA